MNIIKTILHVTTIFLLFVVLFNLVEHKQIVNKLKRKAIIEGAAFYHPKTGKFTWKDPGYEKYIPK